MKGLRVAAKNINPKKAVDVDGILGTAVRVLIEERAEEVLRALNAMNAEGKIPKPGRDPALTSSFQPIRVLSVLSKIWEHTFKNLI